MDYGYKFFHVLSETLFNNLNFKLTVFNFMSVCQRFESRLLLCFLLRYSYSIFPRLLSYCTDVLQMQCTTYTSVLTHPLLGLAHSILALRHCINSSRVYA